MRKNNYKEVKDKMENINKMQNKELKKDVGSWLNKLANEKDEKKRKQNIKFMAGLRF